MLTCGCWSPEPVIDESDNTKSHKEVARWKSWVSLFAQMPREIAKPYFVMRAIEPIESPTAASPIEAESELWTACEWLIHTAYTALECLRYRDLHREGDAPMMGDLCRMAVPDPFSLERWDWWKRRLAELAAPDDVNAETKQRIAKALGSMEAAETRHSEVYGKEEGKDGKEKVKG